MATCVAPDGAGILYATATPVDQCTSYILMDASSYQSLPTLNDVFTMPTASDMGEMWFIGFSIPMIVYLSAWAYQTVINFAHKGG